MLGLGIALGAAIGVALNALVLGRGLWRIDAPISDSQAIEIQPKVTVTQA